MADNPKFPILSIREGEILVNVQTQPNSLRTERPTRYESNLAADSLEVLIAYLDKMNTRMILLKHDLRLLSTETDACDRSCRIQGMLDSIDATLNQLGFDGE